MIKKHLLSDFKPVDSKGQDRKDSRGTVISFVFIYLFIYLWHELGSPMGKHESNEKLIQFVILTMHLAKETITLQSLVLQVCQR